MNKSLLILTLCGFLGLFSGSKAEAGDTIVDLAVGADNFKTLVAAVQAAGLVDALAGEGPLTVFAPTDEAFAKVDADTLKFLLTDRGRPQLQRILLHHVVAGKVTSDQVVNVDEVETLAGTTLDVSVIRGRVLIGDAAVDAVDLLASNGVIHVIDRVLLPPVQENPLETYLMSAISRGVPLFNDGDPAACCAVYATALDALVLGGGFGLTNEERQVIKGRKMEADKMSDSHELAWELRGIIDAVLRGDMAISSSEKVSGNSEAAKEQASDLEVGNMIFSFRDSNEVRGWRTVLDGVMGGLSTGKISHGGKGATLVFEGETSLRNNGGFSSMRCALPRGAMDGSDSIQFRVKGDGRTYIFGTRGSSGSGGDSFWTRFDTIAGEWQTVTIKIDEMERHFFGQKLPGTITPDQVRGIDFYIYDKKAGPFRLEIDNIQAVSTDGRNLAQAETSN